MKKKNGFVFVETMVTVVILASALLIIYSLFNNILVREHRKSYFDDPIYVYRTNYLTLIFEELLKDASTTDENPGQYINFSDLLTVYESGTSQVSNLRIFTCNNDVFKVNAAAQERCNQFFINNQIFRIYISTYDLSYIDQCSLDSTYGPECKYYNGLNSQAKLYFKQLPYVPNSNGYYIIFEYYDDGRDGVCANEKCMHQFASVKYGGLVNVINLNEQSSSGEHSYLLQNLVKNGSFENNLYNFTIDGKTDIEINYSTSDFRLYGNKSAKRIEGSESNKNYLAQLITIKENHIYYYALYSMTNSVSQQPLKFDIWRESGTLVDTNITNAEGWKKRSVLYTGTGNKQIALSINYGANTEPIYIDGVMFIDLTQAFGAGNEPDQAWCDANINYFDNYTIVQR